MGVLENVILKNYQILNHVRKPIMGPEGSFGKKKLIKKSCEMVHLKVYSQDIFDLRFDQSVHGNITINAPAIMKVQEVIFLCGQNTLLGS